MVTGTCGVDKAKEGKMPINISISGVELLKALEITAKSQADLEAAGIEVIVGLDVVKFRTKTGEVVGAVPMGKALVLAVVSGKISGLAMKVAKAKKMIEHLIAKVVQGDDMESELHNPFMFSDSDKAAIAAAPDAASLVVAPATPNPVTPPEKSYTASTTLPDGWSVYPAGNMDSGNRVRLMKATMLYQPVFSTSDDSRYFMVAGVDHLRIAARYRKGRLSVRIEGDVQAIKQRLEDIGIDTDKLANNYASMHLEAIDEFVAAKALGAVLVGLDCGSHLPLPSLGVLMGKGA